MACRNAHAWLRCHSRSVQPRAARSTCRGPDSSRSHALIKSRAGSAAPKLPTSRTQARRPSATRTLPGVRSPWLITSGAARGSSLKAAHISASRRTSSSPALSLKQVLIHASWSFRSLPRPRPPNTRPRVEIARTPAMNSARSAAKAADSAGSSSSPVRPGSHAFPPAAPRRNRISVTFSSSWPGLGAAPDGGLVPDNPAGCRRGGC